MYLQRGFLKKLQIESVLLKFDFPILISELDLFVCVDVLYAVNNFSVMSSWMIGIEVSKSPPIL